LKQFRHYLRCTSSFQLHLFCTSLPYQQVISEPEELFVGPHSLQDESTELIQTCNFYHCLQSLLPANLQRLIKPTFLFFFALAFYLRIYGGRRILEGPSNVSLPDGCICLHRPSWLESVERRRPQLLIPPSDRLLPPPPIGLLTNSGYQSTPQVPPCINIPVLVKISNSDQFSALERSLLHMLKGVLHLKHSM